MSSRRLLPSKPYLPTGGVNFDTNAIAIGENECNGILNLRVLPNEIRMRGGSHRISTNVPSGEPILHTHTFKTPTGNSIFFGFTASAVYRLPSADSSAWTLVSNNTKIDDGSATTGWSVPSTVSGFGTSTIATSTSDPYNGSYLVADYFDPNDNTHPTFQVRKTFAALDLSTYDSISIWLAIQDSPEFNSVPTTQTYAIKFYSDAAWTTLIESFQFTKNFADQDWENYIFEMTTPASWGTVRSFEIVFVSEAGSGGAVPLSRLMSTRIDDLVFFSGAGGNITHWSTCDYIDDTYGATVLAAGTRIPKPTEPEEDGSDRVFLFYNSSTGQFEDVSLRATLQVEEATGVTGSGTSAGPHSGTVAHTDLTPFGFSLSSGGLLVQDDGSGGLTGDGTGSINYTTGAWTVLFSSGVGNITANYLYYDPVAIKPRYVASFANRVILGNTFDDATTYYPWRIWWSDVGDFRTVRGESFIDTIDTDISSIVSFAFIGEYLIIYKEGSVIKMRHIGGDSVFSLYTVWQYGIFAGRTVLSWNNYNLILAKDDVYIFDGNQFKEIATNRVRNKIFTILNNDRIRFCFASFDEKYKEYWLWIATDDNDYPTVVFVYSLQLDAWSYFEFQETTCTGKFYTVPAVTIDELVGTIDQQNWSFEGGTLQGSLESLIMCLADGDTYAYDDMLGEDYIVDGTGTAIPWNLITSDFIFSDLARQDRTQRIHFEARGDSVEVGCNSSYSQETSSFTTLQTISLDTDQKEHQYWPDNVFEYIRFLFQGEGTFSLRWIQAFAVTEEKD